MRIAYIVLTCEKYETTRVPWQKKTVFSSVPTEDLFYLGHVMRPADRLYSWGAGDDYESLPYKFADFFRWSELSYDWYFLMDDDTYVYTDRLQTRVAAMEAEGVHPQQDAYMEGHILTHIADTPWGIYHSGGAGTLLSARVYREVKRMFHGITEEYRSPHWCADICLGLWTKGLVGIRVVHSDRYHTDMARVGVDDTVGALTFHHLKTEEDFLAHQALSCKIDSTVAEAKTESI
jgi:Fringe-like